MGKLKPETPIFDGKNQRFPVDFPLHQSIVFSGGSMMLPSGGFLKLGYWVSDLSRITYPKVVSIMRGLWGKLHHTRLKAHFIMTN